MKVYFTIFFFLSVIFHPLYAQQPRVIYNHTNVESGLNYDQIEYILMDRDGFIWLAIQAGLQRFDGYNFTSYNYDANDSTTISDIFTTTVFEDSQGKIWVGTASNGINVFDKEKNAFLRIKHDPSDVYSLSTNNIPKGKKVIVEDKEGFIWVNTGNGLNRIDTTTHKVERFYGNYQGHIIYDETAHALWIADTTLKKLTIDNLALKTFETQHNIKAIHSMVMDENGLIWLGTDKGLSIFDNNENAFLSLSDFLSKQTQKKSYPWAQDPVRAIYEDYRGHIWLSVEKSVYVVNPKDGSYNIFKHETENENSILDETVTGIYGNHQGTVLITYTSQGITKININSNGFNYIRKKPNHPNTLSSNTIRSILKDQKNNLWIGTYNHGLNRLVDGDPENVVAYRHDPDDANSINSDYITALYIDSGDRLWVGTFENGFCYAENIYDTDKLQFRPSSFPHRVEVHEFTEDQAGRIWISTERGFYIYDKRKETVTHYGDAHNQIPELKKINVQSVWMEAPNTFWLATWNRGICKLVVNSDSLLSSSVSKDSLVIYDQTTDVKGTALDNRFITIHKGRQGDFWLGSIVNGLVKMTETREGVKFTKYDNSSGAPANTVYGIAEDTHGNLWISTKFGIGKFDPATKHFTNYYESDGLQSNYFIWDAAYQHTDGEIFFGGTNGLNTFYPDSISDNKAPSRAYLSKLIINHKEVNIGEEINGRTVLERSIRFTDAITLTHEDVVFSLEFAALNITNPHEVLFEYKLEGFDEEWIHANASNRIATYTNLQKGNYVFKVRASNSFGDRAADPAVLEIIVIPPWWKTWWAFGIYFLVFLLLLYLFQQQLLQRSALKHNLQLEQVKHEKDNELNREKLTFFTNLSHELRTPLTLILGPLERMIRNNEGNNRVQQNLVLIQKQARRLQKLTNQLMNFRKYETDNLRLKAASGNIVGFVKEITIAFRQHAKMKEINFDFKAAKPDIQVWYDRDKFEIILVNLLSNAFKFTPPHGHVQLTISTTTSDGVNLILQKLNGTAYASYGTLPGQASKVLQIEVKDSGCGISSDQLTHIFDRYFQASNIQTISMGGSGIGLEITKNYVELHRGSIMVSSEEGEGTTFFIWLPIGREHLQPDEIIQAFKPSEHKDHYQLGKLSVKEKYADVLSVQQHESDNGNKPLLLIVDDNPDIIFFLQESFHHGYQVETALSGNEGLKKAFALVPDIIISDVMMPEIDGLEFCYKIKSNVSTSHIPVILLTARTSNVFRVEGYETGADDYISKPFDEKVLHTRVKNLIASRKKLRKRYIKEITLQPKDLTITQPDEKFLDKVIKIIEENISDHHLKVERIAKEMGMSHSVLYKKIMALTDLTVVEFVRTIRLKKAAFLLTQPNMTVGQASYEVGFTDPKYFSKCFQKFFGATPSTYASDMKNVEELGR